MQVSATFASDETKAVEMGRTLRDAREGKAAAYLDDIHLPTEPPKLLDDAPVIAITSGQRGEITRHGERDAQFIGWQLAHSTDQRGLLWE